ncbi:unnamed protein product [Closterium sp. NIES-65]|nr:unnamed protein product [Closterium sp. NIES-65]
MDLKPWIIGCSRLREAIKKNDLTCFESVFDADITVLPIITTIGPLPGVHCNVVVVLRPGDLLKAIDVDSETSFRHLDPKTANRLHSSEALTVVRLPDIVKNEQVGTGLLAVSTFGWVVRERGALLKLRAPASAENPMVQGLRALKSALVEYVKRCVAERRSAPSNHPTGPSTSPLNNDRIETKTASQASMYHPVYFGVHDTRTSGHVGGGGEADLVGGEERRAGSVEESSTDSESESGSEEEEDEEVEDEEEEEERAGKKAVGAEADCRRGGRASRRTHQAPVVGVGGDTGALGVEDDPVARALMEELLAFQAPSQQQPVTIDNAAVPTTHGGAQPVAGTAPTAPVSADVNARHTAAPFADPPTSGPVAAPSTGQDNAGQTLTDPVAAMLLAAVNSFQAAAPSSHPPTTVTSAAPTMQLPAAVATPSDPVSDMLMAKTVQPARLASTGVSVAGQAVPPIQSHPVGFIQVDRAFQTGPSGVTGSDQAGLAGESTRPTAVTVATQAGQAGPSDRSAGVTVADLAGQAETSTVLAGGPVGEHADKDGQTDRAAGVGEKKKKRKGKAAASQKAVVPKDRRGHGIRLDRTSGGGWQGEVNLAGKSRYTGRSDDRMEVAYLNGVATTIFDGHASQLLLVEMTGVKAEEMTRWKAEWEEAKVMPKGMWTVMWSRGATMFRARFQKVLANFKQKKSSGPPLMKLLRPAVWFGTGWEPAKRKQQLSDIINRACLCAAFVPVAANAVPKTGADAKRIGQAVATSSCAVWCFAETVAEVGNAAGEAKAAALLCEASTDFADTCHDVVVVVLETAVARQPVLGEVSCNVTDALQKDALRKACKGCDPTPDAEIIARATIETLAFWGSCNAGGPLL